jgi:hypothetical protein
MAQIVIDGKSGGADSALKRVAGGFRGISGAAKQATVDSNKAADAAERADMKAERRLKRKAGDFGEVTGGAFGKQLGAGVGAFAQGGAAGLGIYAAVTAINALGEIENKLIDAKVKENSAVRDFAAAVVASQRSMEAAAASRFESTSINDRRGIPGATGADKTISAINKQLKDQRDATLSDDAIAGKRQELVESRTRNLQIALKQLEPMRSALEDQRTRSDEQGNFGAFLANLRNVVTLGSADPSETRKLANQEVSFQRISDHLISAATALDRAANRAANVPGN